MTAKGLEGGRDYRQWPEALRMHEAGAIRELYAKHEAEVHFWKFCQYEFFTQWRALKAYANEKGVRILGDIPIYVSPDSADVWAGRELFWLDEAGLGGGRLPTGLFFRRRPALGQPVVQLGSAREYAL